MSKPLLPLLIRVFYHSKRRTLPRPPACHPRPTGQRSETGSFIPLPQGLGGSDELPYVNSAVHRQHFQNPVSSETDVLWDCTQWLRRRETGAFQQLSQGWSYLFFQEESRLSLWWFECLVPSCWCLGEV